MGALALATEWKPFRYPDFAVRKKAMKSPVIFDARNQYDPGELRQFGFEHFGIGWEGPFETPGRL